LLDFAVAINIKYKLMDKLEIAFHVSVAAITALAVGLAVYGLMVISLAFMKVLG
jgi:hypothetical protein